VKGGEETRKHGLPVCLILALVAFSAVARQGSFLDSLTFVTVDSQQEGIAGTIAGDIDIHGCQVTGGSVQLLIDNNIPYDLAFGGYRSLLYNIPEYFDDGRFNPLGDPVICQATQKMLDRDYMAAEFLFGNAIPMYSPVRPMDPTWTQIIVESTKTKLAFAFDEELAFQMIEDRMLELGFAKNAAGIWEDDLGEIEIVGCIHVGDERHELGDYFLDQMERAGFRTRRIYGSSGDLYNYWGGTLPGDGAWNFYTEGWGSGAISLTSVWAWAQMYTDLGFGAPPYTCMTREWCAEEFGPGFYDAAEGILTGTYSSVEERLEFFAHCESAMRNNPTRFWAWNNASAYMVPEGIAVVHDLAAGTFLHRWTPHTLRYVDADGAPVVGGDMVVSSQSFLITAINPVDGSNSTYDLMVLRPTMDFPIYIHPHTGVPIPHLVEHAEVEVLAGKPVGIFPVTVEDGWCELEFVDSIAIPGGAWADWDAVNQVFITVDEVCPDGVTDAVHKTTITYPYWLFDGTVVWHDGSSFSLADMVFGLIIGFPFDRAKPESSIYDAYVVSGYNAAMASFRGLKIISEDPLVVEIYDSGISLYAETIAQNDAGILWPSSGAGFTPAWHQTALGIKVEAQGLGAFGQGKANELGVDWMNCVAGPQLQVLLGELDTAQYTSQFLPYAPMLGNYVTADEIQERYNNLATFANEYGHLWIGTGPMMLTQVDTLAGIAVLENNPHYLYETGHYVGRFGEPGRSKDREAAEWLLNHVELPEMSEVFFIGISGGTTIEEMIPYSEEGGEEPKVLQIPDRDGEFYAYFIDDAPWAKYSHSVRYVWADLGTGEHEIADASWLPEITPPDGHPLLLEVLHSFTLRGTLFRKGKGSGRTTGNPVTHKLTATANIQTPSTTTTCGGRKFALILDAGDLDGFWCTLADNMADDADGIQTWVAGEGFTITRVSQYWGNGNACIKSSGNTDKAKKQSLKAGLKSIFSTFATRLQCCDSFFLYINGHGGRVVSGGKELNPKEGYFSLYDPSGDGLSVAVEYDELAAWMAAFPPCVKATVFIDACYSGRSINSLRTIRAGLSKLIIITACDEDHIVPGGQASWIAPDSSTEDFNEGADKDHDGDGKKGDITDRFKEMERQGGSYKPQLDSDSRHPNNCVLD